MSHVVIAFQADRERTEQMALAVGIGAVEAEASIRLRDLRFPERLNWRIRDMGGSISQT